MRTFNGGYSCGTVVEVDSLGRELVLHTFTCGKKDGKVPRLLAGEGRPFAARFIHGVDSSSFSVRGPSVREPADPTDASPAPITWAPRRTPRIRNCKTSSLQAQSLQSLDGRYADCAS
jgi:hypothetical protein